MTDAEKTTLIRGMLGDNTLDVSVYLDFTKNAILDHLYTLVPQPSTITEVPKIYEMVQVQAVIAGWNSKGGENESMHSENGVSRTFHFSDCLQYIQSNVIPYVRLN